MTQLCVGSLEVCWPQSPGTSSTRLAILRLSDMTYPQFASTLAMSRKQRKGIHGRILGNTILAVGIAVSGVTTSYILKKTGRDYAVVKGLGVALVQGIILGGTWPKLGLLAKPRMAKSHTFALMEHAIFGLLSGFIISKMQGQETKSTRTRNATRPSSKVG